MTVVVVGKNSFAAGHFPKMDECRDWVFLSHEDALEQKDWLEHVSVLINCAFSSKLYKEPYDPEEDMDLKLARLIKDKPKVHYFMISSRLVYGDKKFLSEDIEPAPHTQYGKNKLITESKLLDILGISRLCILRCSNIFGFELGRARFFGMMLSTLKSQGKIIFDMAAETKKDFIPVSIFSEIVARAVSEKCTGIYNLGSGLELACGDYARWLIEGYGHGVLEISEDVVKGQFIMDVSKINKRLNLVPVSADELKQECLDLGKRLQAT